MWTPENLKLHRCLTYFFGLMIRRDLEKYVSYVINRRLTGFVPFLGNPRAWDLGLTAVVAYTVSLPELCCVFTVT